MPGSNDIKAGGAYVSIGTKQTQFERGLASAQKKLQAFGGFVSALGKKLSGLGAISGVLEKLGVAPTDLIGPSVLVTMAGMVEKFVETGVELQRLHQQLGMSVEDLSALKAMAAESGVSLEELANDFGKFQIALATGKGDAALKNLGISAAQLNGKNTAEQLAVIADGFAKVRDQGVKAAAARDLFGRGGLPMIRVLNQGGDAMRERLSAGGTFTGEDAERAEQFHLALLKIKRAISGVALALGGELVRALADYAEPIVRGVQVVAGWIKEHRQVIVVVAAIAATLVAGGAALVAFGATFAAIGTAIAAIPAIIIGLKVAVLALIGVFAMLVPVAIIAGLAYLLYQIPAVRRLLGELGEAFGKLWGRVSETWGQMGEAFKAGDMQSAMKIGWLRIQAEFWRGIKYLRLAWTDFVDWMGEAIHRGLAKTAKFISETFGEALGSIGIKINSPEKIDQLLKEEIDRRAADRAKLAGDYDQKIAGLEGEIKCIIDEVRRKAKAVKPAVANQIQQLQSMGLSDTSKGTLSSYAISQSLAINEKVSERIASATEETASNTDRAAAALENLKPLAFA